MSDALKKEYTRRSLLVRGGVVGAGALIGGGYTANLYRQSFFDKLTVTSYTVKAAKWPPYLSTLKIAFLSDFHVGCAGVDLKKLQTIVAQVNGLNADIILLGGDYVVGNRPPSDPDYVQPEAIAKELTLLKAPLGVFAVLGNHDWRQGTSAVKDALEDAGLKVLENESVFVPYGEKGFYVVGLADYLTRHPRYVETVTEIQNDHPKIVISHDPYTFKDMPEGVLIQLSGHTHGGQVSLPFIGPVVNPTPQSPLRWSYGLIEENGNRMIVSSGIGTSVFPIKNTPCEVVFLTLETASTLES